MLNRTERRRELADERLDRDSADRGCSGATHARRMYERRGWWIVDGEELILVCGVVEVQYRLDLRQPDSIG